MGGNSSNFRPSAAARSMLACWMSCSPDRVLVALACGSSLDPTHGPMGWMFKENGT